MSLVPGGIAGSTSGPYISKFRGLALRNAKTALTRKGASVAMPTYEYECTKCGHRFEEIQSIKAEPLKKCPEKGCRGRVRRLISAGGGLLFKGSGFYITDYRSDSYKQAAKADKTDKADTSSSSSSSSKSDISTTTTTTTTTSSSKSD